MASVGLAIVGILDALPASALNFRLETVTVEEDGFSHQKSVFEGEPGVKINIDPPAGWVVSSDEASISAVPATLPDCQIKLEKSPLTTAVAFKDQGLDTYRKYCLSRVPGGATGIHFTEEKASPLPIFHWEDYEFVLAYDLFGQAYKRSTVFVNLNAKTQVLVTSVATTGNYDAIHVAGLDMMRSWTQPPPKR